MDLTDRYIEMKRNREIWDDYFPPLNLFNYPSKMLEENKGTKYDGGKPPMALLDAPFLEGVASVLGFGAEKYAAHNWRGGISYSRLISAAYRHLGAINRGEDIDAESGLSHAYHLGCCTMFLASMMHTRPDMDDRYKA